MKQKLGGNDLLRHNLVFFIGTMGIAIFNYLYYPVISRLVSVPEFGEIQAVISLFMQLGIVLTAFGYVITNIVSNAQNRAEANGLILYLEQIMLILCLIFFPVLLAVAHVFSDSFKLHSVLPVVLVGVLILINIPATSRSYVLQGLKHLKEVSIGGIVYAAGKLLLTVALIYLLTDNVVAAIFGYIIAQLLTLWYLQVRLGGRYVSLKDTFQFLHLQKLNKHQLKLIHNEGRYGIMIAVVMASLTLLYSSDTIMARLFFDAHTLGVYSGISSVARIIFFVTASVAGVLIASVRLRSTVSENRHILIRSIMIIGAVGGVGTILFAVFPRFFVGLLVGDDYLIGQAWLPPLALVMLICSINNLLAIYQIALRRFKTIYPVVLGVIVLVVGLVVFHDSIEQFIGVLLVSNLLVAVLLSIEIGLEKRKR